MSTIIVDLKFSMRTGILHSYGILGSLIRKNWAIDLTSWQRFCMSILSHDDTPVLSAIEAKRIGPGHTALVFNTKRRTYSTHQL